MQGSHTHVSETNHIPRGYIVAAILSLLFMVPLFLVPALVLLFFYVSTFRSICGCFPRQTMSLGDTVLQLFCLCFYGASMSSSCVGSVVLLR